MSPTARKIVDFKGDHKISTNVHLLHEIFDRPEVKDKQVCVVSITGTFRQGKSFLLNFLLRYLNLKYKTKSLSGEKWLDVGSADLSGFAWRCGSERHTTGILIWSEIFIAQLPSKEEIAIVLMDTQGTFDNKTTRHHCAAIFAISTLISSVQIYNLKNQINQADLEHLECFSGYGQLALDQSSREPPFQNLCFLIRDWQYPFEAAYGTEGGQHYLNKFLNSEQPELKKQNDNIRNLFQKIDCCLLPHPGIKVATNPSFLGEMKDIDEGFLQSVEAFVPSILSPEQLVPKTMNGEKIKVGDLADFIQSYCRSFMNDEMPKLESMYLATSTAHHKVVLSEALQLYQNAMDSLVNETSDVITDDHLKAKHALKKLKAVEYVKKKKVMGDEEMKSTSIAKLSQTLDGIFPSYRRINQMKLQRKEDMDKFNRDLQKTRDKFDSKIENCQGIIEEQASTITHFTEIQKELQLEIQNLQSKIADLRRSSPDKDNCSIL